MSTRTALLQQVALNLAVSAVVVGVALWAYERYVREPQTPRFAVVDVADIYRLKTSQLVDDMLKAGEGKEARDAVKQNADSFGSDVERLIGLVARDCACVVLARPAVVGGTAGPDYTDAIKKRLGL